MRRKQRRVRRRAAERRPAHLPSGTGPLWQRPAATATRSSLPGSQYASTWRRAAAYALDSSLLLAVWLAAQKLGLQRGVVGVVSIWYLAAAAFDFVYFAVGWWRFEATLGQRALGLRVLDAEGGGAVNLRQAVLRWFFLDSLATVIAALATVAGVAWIGQLVSEAYILVLLLTTAWNPAHQGLHDQLARTIVVMRAAETTPARSLKVML